MENEDRKAGAQTVRQSPAGRVGVAVLPRRSSLPGFNPHFRPSFVKPKTAGKQRQVFFEISSIPVKVGHLLATPPRET
jgi:hypothetical protein